MDEAVNNIHSTVNDSSKQYCFEPYRFVHLKPHYRYDHPLPRSGHRIVCDDLYIYSFGGFNPNVNYTSPYKPLLKELWRFSKLTRSWQKLNFTGPAPNELASHCALLLQPGFLLVYGGSGYPFGQANSNTISILNLKSLVWSKIEHANEVGDANIPDPGYGQALAYDRERQLLYVCGGTSGYDYTLNVNQFDFNTKRWELLSRTPHFIDARYRHEMAFYKNKLYIIGGGTTSTVFSNDMIPVFDISTKTWSLECSNTWSDSSLYPEPRYSHGCAHIGQEIFMVGGADNETIFDDTWSLNLETLSWTKYPKAKLPISIYFHAVAITESGEMTVFGGATCLSRKKRSNFVYNAWFKVPNLRKIALDAIVSFLDRKDKSKLKLGLSIDSLNRFFEKYGINPVTVDLPEI